MKLISMCTAVLAVVAQINASGCGCGLSPVVVPSGSTVLSSPTVFVSSGNSAFGDSSSSAVGRNLVASGKYPIALRNCGPVPDQHVPITTSRLNAPVVEKPTVRLPASIPVPRTVSHSCTCYKTILRPRVHQQLITVPTVQRYVETTHKPVVEKIQYEGLPINCGNGGSGVQFVQVGSGGSGSLDLLSLGSGSQIQTVEIPPVQFPQIQPVQTIQVPHIQTVQIAQPVSFGSCSCQC